MWLSCRSGQVGLVIVAEGACEVGQEDKAQVQDWEPIDMRNWVELQAVQWGADLGLKRKASFRKRMKGLIKKVAELSTLCGVDACVIIYSPYHEEPMVWPSREGAEAVLSRFNALSEMERRRKMVNLDIFIRQRIKKAEEQLHRMRKENKRIELEMFMYRCIAGKASITDFDTRDAEEMRRVVNQTLENINARMEAIRINAEQEHQHGPSSASAPTPHPPPTLVRATRPAETRGEYMESFPWNLADSPSAAFGTGSGTRLDVLPYPSTLNNMAPSTSGAPPEPGPNNSDA
ncbi:hypothetical protein BUALT_Bualt01G0184400 [Buddleja alternifolia]|uniref:MADS-box domain-containing protein n=1 Tax=Buddleja alternifolia TaxID=168488 RepID=A0AAV6YE26_9LAMI|nr:hypothetical protein BUALT_Bualt01G0184400 [Buddleja alternifolia]